MNNFALIVAYDGTNFAGFQLQQNGRTIQRELESALRTVLRESVRVHCAGRTDAGVHATGQVVSFQIDAPVPEERRIIHSLNALLPDDISVSHAMRVPDDFHPRFSCVAREYEYLIWNAPIRPVHLAHCTHWHRGPIPVESLNEELKELLGEMDFASFTRHEYREESTVRYLDHAELVRLEDPVSGERTLIALRIRGNAFLHNMIRIIVGTLLDRAKGKIGESLGEIQKKRSRLIAGTTIAPTGLFFRNAYYRTMPGVPHLCYLDDYPNFRNR